MVALALLEQGQLGLRERDELDDPRLVPEQADL
jgi:hypothetical protein